MKARQRAFSGERDIREMMALAHLVPADNLHVVDLPFRLCSWALDCPKNLGLWVNTEGRLLAWAVMQVPFWTVDYVCYPEADPDLHRQILVWADHRARQAMGTPNGHPCWFVMVYASQMDRICDLEQAGFACQADVGEDSWSKVVMHRPVRMPVADYALPPGFSIRPLAGKGEIKACVRLHRAVFESKNMTVEWRARTLLRPEYRADLDLVAVAPDGRLAAFCVGWLDAASPSPHGQIEPLGVDPEFRDLGLGRAILSEAVQRLALCGADTVMAETDKYRNAALALYEAVGFRVTQDVWVYRKDYSVALG